LRKTIERFLKNLHASRAKVETANQSSSTQRKRRFPEADRNVMTGYFEATKKSRYRASDRLNLKAKYARLAILLNSVILVGVSIFQIGFTTVIPNGTNNILSCYVLVITIVTLLQSYYNNPENYIMLAKEYHQCANDINRIYFMHKTKDLNLMEERDYNELIEEYYSILDKYPPHETIDFEMGILGDLRKKDKLELKDHWKNIRTKVKHFVNISMPLMFFVISFAILVYIAYKTGIVQLVINCRILTTSST